MFCIFGQFLWWSLDSYRFRGSGLKRESDDHLFGEVFQHFLVGLAYSFSVFIFSRTLVILDVRCYLLVFAFGDHKCDYHHCGSFWEKVTSHAKWEENIMHLWFWETNSYLMHLTYSQRLFLQNIRGANIRVKLEMIIKFLVSGYLYQDSWTSWALPGDKSCWRKSSQNEVIFFLEKNPYHLSFITHFGVFFCSLAKILLVFVWIFPMEFSTQKGSWAPSIEIELWGRIALTVLMSYSEKSPGYLAQMQNWPSVADLRTRGGRRVDGQQTFSLRYFWALTLYGVIKEFTSHSPVHQSLKKIW